MRSDEKRVAMPEEVRAELDALDALLAGDPPPEGSAWLADVLRAVDAARTDPEAGFAASLDEWAAKGFPRGAGPFPSPRRRPSLRDRLPTLSPWRLAPAAAVATAAVVAVVTVGDFGERDESTLSGSSSGDDVAESAVEAEDRESGARIFDLLDGKAATPTSGQENRGFAAVPNLDAAVSERSNPAGGEEIRRVERDASLTIAAPTDEVQDVTNEAVAIVQGHRGIVLSSESRTTEGEARATLDLVIPTKTLDQTITDLSGLADVKSLSEGSVDITRPFVDAKDRLAGLRAERRAVIAQLKAAATQTEIDQLRARLEGVQREVAEAEAEFDGFQRRARLSSLSLQITSGGASDEDDGWSFSEALDDAGDVLTVAAGVAVISAAVLIPLALVSAIAFGVAGRATRRSRERALGD